MGRRVKETIKKVNKVTEIVGSHHTGAYAAQAAYFFVLSMIPIILLLLTAVQFTPATYANVIDAVEQVFPTSVQGFIRSIVTQVYFSQSAKIIPITILVALWSAGRGVLSVTAGLNCIYGNTETRNYVYLRLRASLYTVIFILAIVLSLVLSVFGNSISAMIYKHAPFWSTLMQYIIKIRTVMTLAVLTVFWDLVYKYLYCGCGPHGRGENDTLSEISCSRIIVYFHRNLVDTWQWMQYKHIGRSQLHFLFVQDIEIFHADIIFFVEETFFLYTCHV